MSDHGLTDFSALAARAQRMQEDLADAREDLASIEGVGHGADGLIRAAMDGEHRLVSLTIDPAVIDPGEPQTLAEAVRDAVNAALDHANAQRSQRMDALSGGMQDVIEGLRRIEYPPPAETLSRLNGRLRLPGLD